MEHKNTVSIISSIFVHLVVFCVFITSKIMLTSAFYSNSEENAIQVNFVRDNEPFAVKQKLDNKVKKAEKDPFKKKQIKKHQDLNVKKSTPQKSEDAENKTQKTSKNNSINSESSKELKYEKTDKKDLDSLKKVNIKKDHNSTKKDNDINKKSISESADNTSKSRNDLAKEKSIIDKRALYGNGRRQPRGAMLEMKGWTWDNVPVPTDTTKEVGILIFEISVNQYGEITRINTLERTVSLRVETIYRASLESITLSKTDNNDLFRNNSKIAKGKVTFFIRYR